MTEPGSLDFAEIRDAINCPKSRPILEFIESLTTEAEKDRARRILDKHEMEAARRSLPNHGAEDLVRFLRSRKIRLGIISRNSTQAIMLALENFQTVRATDFEAVISRDESLLPKPSPETVLAASRRMNIPPARLLVVGDFVFDIEAGREAGTGTVFLTNRNPSSCCKPEPDFTISGLPELKEIVELRSPLSPGKLPNAILGKFLNELCVDDPTILIPPRIGEDIAALSLKGDDVLILKSDPITFATDAIGYYAVVVNANDIATCGADPRWLLVSLLFPPGSTAAQIRQVVSDLQQTARHHGMILCGGHTEITDAVTRPVAVGQAAGTVSKSCMIDKRSMKEGDQIILTKGIALEGTSIIAREFPDRLLDLGIAPAEVERCRSFLADPGLSILEEARIASASGAVTAMHDVTEGGLATAMEEFSAAGLHRLRIYAGRIPVLEETKRICALLSINPLGLIASGSLLISCRPGEGEKLVQTIRIAGTEATVIGEVLGAGEGVEARNERDEIIPWPHFETDQITELFKERGGLGVR